MSDHPFDSAPGWYWLHQHDPKPTRSRMAHYDGRFWRVADSIGRTKCVDWRIIVDRYTVGPRVPSCQELEQA